MCGGGRAAHGPGQEPREHRGAHADQTDARRRGFTRRRRRIVPEQTRRRRRRRRRRRAGRPRQSAERREFSTERRRAPADAGHRHERDATQPGRARRVARGRGAV